MTFLAVRGVAEFWRITNSSQVRHSVSSQRRLFKNKEVKVNIPSDTSDKRIKASSMC